MTCESFRQDGDVEFQRTAERRHRRLYKTGVLLDELPQRGRRLFDSSFTDSASRQGQWKETQGRRKRLLVRDLFGRLTTFWFVVAKVVE